MAISGDYARPVTVNGFACRNCTDVDNAKKHIDPARPKDGPFGVNAKDDATSSRPPAFSFGGVFADRQADAPASRKTGVQSAFGARLDVSV